MLGLLFQAVDVVSERRWNTAGRQECGVRSCVRFAPCEQICVPTKGPVLHERLPAVLLVLGSRWFGGAVGTCYHDDLLAPSSRLGPERLGHGVRAGELEEGHVLEGCGGGTHEIVVEDGGRGGALFFFQSLFHRAGPVQAENDEVARCPEHGQLEQEVARLLCQVVPLSHAVDEQLLHRFEGVASFLETAHYGREHLSQGLRARLTLGDVLGAVLDDFAARHDVLHVDVGTPHRQLHGVEAVDHAVVSCSQ